MAMKPCMELSAADMICDDPFDSIDDLLDFPNDDDVLAVVEACGVGGAPLAPPEAPAMSSAGSGGEVNAGAASGGLQERPAAISGGFKQENDALGLCNDIDIGNLEWLSNFFEDTEFNFDFPASPAAAGASIKIPNNRDDHSLFRSSSPISVLEPNSLSGRTTTTIGTGAYSSSTTSSCSSSSNSIPDRSISAGPPPAPIDVPIVPARARTKRPRPPSFSARSFVPPPSSEYPAAISYPARPAEPESVGESHGPVAMKKKKKQKAVVFESGEENWAEGAAAPPVRKCMHCEIQRTPQWRAGPMGPKTLCNACGVRYKSGRLFPEYRPAASPTFVPSIHSNSHKKVVEMRLNSNQTVAGNVGMQPQEGTVAAKNCDLLKYIRGQD